MHGNHTFPMTHAGTVSSIALTASCTCMYSICGSSVLAVSIIKDESQTLGVDQHICPNVLAIRRAALRIRKYGTWRLFAEQRLANHSTALFCAWAEALLGVECVVVFFAAGQIGVVGCVFWDTSYY